MENANRPINPQIGSNTNNQHQLSEVYTDENNPGLTKREHFSSLFLQGMLSGRKDTISGVESSVEYYCKVSIKLADELLKQLDKK